MSDIPVDLIEQVLQRTPSPVVDDVVWLLQRGAADRALRSLLESEGHWLLLEDAQLFIRYCVHMLSGSAARFDAP